MKYLVIVYNVSLGMMCALSIHKRYWMALRAGRKSGQRFTIERA